MAGMVPSQTGRGLFLSKDSVHTATADPNQPRNLLFGVTSVEQFPDELVPHNAGGMIVLTGLISLPCLRRRGNRERLSGQEPGGGFEDLRIALEEALEGCRITKDLPTVTRDPPDFRMGCKPSGCGLL
jgi:hypothetical protein